MQHHWITESRSARLDREARMEPGPTEQLGTVVTFPPGMPRARAEAILALMGAGGSVSWTPLERFDPTYGGPVWYIP